VAIAAVVERRALGVPVTYRAAADGEPMVEDLAEAWRQPFEALPPVRRIASFKGQRHFAGGWWCASTGTHVGYESWLERDHLMLLDFAPEVVGVSSQPCTLELDTSAGTRRHTPDYFARLHDGTGVIVDVRPDARVKEPDAAVFSATAAACTQVGWRYERVGEIDPVYAANVRWLAGYRHSRCLNRRYADALLEKLDSSASPTIASVADEVGDRVAVLPTLFHLLWNRSLATDLRSAILHLASPVHRGIQ
jgi:hypothetical protein